MNIWINGRRPDPSDDDNWSFGLMFCCLVAAVAVFVLFTAIV